MKRTGSIIWGAFLIIIGLLFLADRFFESRLLSIDTLWPLFILVPGLIFESSYFLSKNSPGLLVPGGILTTVGIIFLIFTMVGHFTIHYTWPLFPMAVAIGLFQLYLHEGRHWGLLIPVCILAGVSLIMLASVLTDTSLGIILISAAFIVVGLIIIFGGYQKK